jgi:hypothetical protein
MNSARKRERNKTSKYGPLKGSNRLRKEKMKALKNTTSS